MREATAKDLHQEAGTLWTTIVADLLRADGVHEAMVENAHLDAVLLWKTIMIEGMEDAAHLVIMVPHHQDVTKPIHTILEDRRHHLFEATETHMLEATPMVGLEARHGMAMLVAMATRIADTRMIDDVLSRSVPCQARLSMLYLSTITT